MTAYANHNQAESDKADCVTAICKCGRIIIMAVVEGMSRETKKDLGEAAAKGCDIKHMPAEEVRKQPFGCQCQKTHSDKTPDLFSAPAP